MARKTNYAFDRNSRAKAKAAKREAKRQAKLSAKADKTGATGLGPMDDESTAETEAVADDQDDLTDGVAPSEN